MIKERAYQTPRRAEVIEVIHTVALRGSGTEKSPIREVNQYWDKDGNLLAEKDDCK